jgi:hypothetical protein
MDICLESDPKSALFESDFEVGFEVGFLNPPFLSRILNPPFLKGRIAMSEVGFFMGRVDLGWHVLASPDFCMCICRNNKF